MYEAHPASELFPMMDIVGLAALMRDIKANGLQEPIVLWEGKILDGRNRLWACQKAGVEPRFRELKECDSPTATVLSSNLYRRQLSVSQRAMIGALAKRELKEEARLRQEASRARPGQKIGQPLPENAVAAFPPPDKFGKARDHAAALVGVSGRSVEAACQVLSSEKPEIIEAVRAGRMTVNKAAQIVARRAEQQPTSVEKSQQTDSPARIRLCTPQQFLDPMSIETADLLISRPAFNTDPDHFEAHARHWLGLAVEPMKYSSRIFLICKPELAMVHALSAACLRNTQFRQCDIMVLSSTGPVRGTGSHDYRRQHHLVLHLRGLDAPVLDVCGGPELSSLQRDCSSLGEYAERLIRHTTKPGDLVIDPCAEMGDFLLAAARIGRRALGATSEKGLFNLALRDGCVCDD
jgi:hypothetical protein